MYVLVGVKFNDNFLKTATEITYTCNVALEDGELKLIPEQTKVILYNLITSEVLELDWLYFYNNMYISDEMLYGQTGNRFLVYPVTIFSVFNRYMRLEYRDRILHFLCWNLGSILKITSDDSTIYFHMKSAEPIEFQTCCPIVDITDIEAELLYGRMVMD